MSKKTITETSGNVFADVGLPDADELATKAALANAIASALEDRGLSQARAAEGLGVDQPTVSKLVRGQLSGFSTDRLFRFLVVLGHGVEITIRPRTRKRARVEVRTA